MITGSPVTVYAESGFQNTSRFHEDGGVLIDFDNQIFWKKCTVGQDIVNNKCAGFPSMMGFQRALDLAQDTKEWRLPTNEEYQSIKICRHPTNGQASQTLDRCSGDFLIPTVNEFFGWILPVKYWGYEGHGNSFTFSFYSGNFAITPDTEKHLVLLVKDFIKK